MDLNNKIALVTGGGRGIGHAIARTFHEAGATVVAAQRTAGDNNTLPFIATDFTDTDSTNALIPTVVAQFGGIDILVNNAGLMAEARTEAMSLEDWNRTITVNLTAPFLLAKAAIPVMRSRGGGSILNIGSIEGIGANPEHAAYAASKAGLHGLTRAIAVDEGADGIRCNAIAPGWIDTDLNEAFIDSMPDPTAFRAKIATIHPVGHTGKPDDVAALALWLVSDQAAFVTGQTYVVDGGRMAKLSLPG